MPSDTSLFRHSGGPPHRPSADPTGVPDIGTPLYDELVGALSGADDAATAGESVRTTDPATIEAAVVLTLFARLKAIEDPDGGRPSADVVDDEVCAWFAEFGIDVNADTAAAARALRLPSHLASALTASHLRDGEFAIHLRTENTEPADDVRAHVSSLVRALGAHSSAAVFDHAGDQIAHIAHLDTDPSPQ